ncbi:MAG: DNA repair protein RecN [Acidiferrobacteraceae bacterium]
MLSALVIRDVAIIDRAELSLEGGLTVITGETGAGKSIAVDALGLVLGGRAAADIIRSGATRAEVVAHFEIEGHAAAADWLRDQELLEDHECIIRRTVDTKGSRAFINSRPVPVQSLKELGLLLVELHGQNEHQSLLRTPAQRALLDDYAGQRGQAVELARRYRELTQARDTLAGLFEARAVRDARRALLEHEMKELQAVGLSRDEIAALLDRHRRASHALEMREGLAMAQAAIEDDADGGRERIARALGAVRSLADFDRRLGSLAERLDALLIELGDIGRELRSVQGENEPEPEEFAALETKLAEIDRLARKHRVPAEALPEVCERLEREWQDYGAADESAEALAGRIGALEATCRALATALSEGRRSAAARLAARVTDRLPALGLAGATFTVTLDPLPEISSSGLEQVEFAFSGNDGQIPKPLSRVASGGELSRISLALQVELSGTGATPTLVFDEVDVGIGGAVAERVGRELKALGADRQVLCVTHLPQVAVHGTHHYQVRKHARAGAVTTAIQPLSGSARVQEIARMLGGVEETPRTVALASEMLRRVAS